MMMADLDLDVSARQLPKQMMIDVQEDVWKRFPSSSMLQMREFSKLH
jgi:hypothetical protein